MGAGAYKLSSPEKGGLLEGGGLFERGGLNRGFTINSSASKTIISYSLSCSLYYGNIVFPFFVGRLTMVIIKLCCYFPHLLLGLLIDR